MSAAFRKPSNWAALLVWLTVACSFGGSGPAGEPPRPQGVPARAVWIGGVDGGAFVVLDKRQEDAPRIYRAEIFYDSNGEVWYRGRLVLEPKGSAPVDVTRSDLLEGWDGQVLHLRDDRSLKAIDPEK